MKNNEFYIDEPKRSWPRIITLVLALGLVTLLTVGAYFYTKVNQAASSESVPVNFIVAKGSSTKSIAKALSDQKVISSYWSFILYTKLHDAGGKIQAGKYTLDRNMSISQIVNVLTAGKVVPSDHRVTVVEGMTNKQMAIDLEKRNIFSASDFNQALSSTYNFKYNDIATKFAVQGGRYEGFLFPDTYQLSKDPTASELVQKMLSNFENKLTSQMVGDMQAKNLKLENVMVLASIIEKEVGRNKTLITAEDIKQMQTERSLVASVFYNRLRIGMPLESDATVNYITGKADRSVTIADTKIKSPYNTYQVKGLPPSPISNPGIDSIRAAIYPASTDYFYFLSSPDGTAYFAKTLAEHNQNRTKFLR